jgi:hypothetical protein
VNLYLLRFFKILANFSHIPKFKFYGRITFIKIVTKNQRDWPDRVFEALWAYRVTVRTPTQATPYSLVYGSEVVLPLGVLQVPSLRVAVHEEITNDEQI